jgi:hypothetical protein
MPYDDVLKHGMVYLMLILYAKDAMQNKSNISEPMNKRSQQAQSQDSPVLLCKYWHQAGRITKSSFTQTLDSKKFSRGIEFKTQFIQQNIICCSIRA